LNMNSIPLRTLMAAVVCCLGTSTALAESTRLTLPGLLEQSRTLLRESGGVREEQSLREAARTRAGSLPNPILDLEGATGSLTGSSAESSLSLGVSQEFLLAGKRGKRLAAAERELELQRLQMAERERVLHEEVSTAYYDLLLAEQRVTLAERFILLNRQLLDVARERLAAGDIPELEFNLVKVELARSVTAQITARRELAQGKARLRNLSGRTIEGTGVTIGLIDSQPFRLPPLEELKRLAQANRTDLRIIAGEKNKGEAELDLARAEAVPNLTAGLAFRRDTTGMEIGGVEGRDTAYTLGLKLSLPIPLFDRNQAGIQEARARIGGAKSRLAAAQAKVDREVENARDGLFSAESILELYRTTVLAQLEENLRLTREAYQLGEVGVLAVIQEQKKFFEVNDGYLTALHDRQTALVRLESVIASDLTGGGK